MKGLIRWSSWSYNTTIFVKDVSFVNYRKRLFCFFDKDKPYVLDVFYKPEWETRVILVPPTLIFPIPVSEYKTQSFRYETKEQCVADYNNLLQYLKSHSDN
jgi:hypothetical protein